MCANCYVNTFSYPTVHLQIDQHVRNLIHFYSRILILYLTAFYFREGNKKNAIIICDLIFSQRTLLKSPNCPAPTTPALAHTALYREYNFVKQIFHFFNCLTSYQ